jgi:Permease for cytosine/purines, uracil, thiamine, allantoin
VTVAEPAAVSDGTYRDRLVAVEPGGNEAIAEQDRHGRPRQLFWTWTSPNLEFATIFVGVLAVSAYGMTFWQATVGIALGTALGAAAHWVLSARGPSHGVPQIRHAIGRCFPLCTAPVWIGRPTPMGANFMESVFFSTRTTAERVGRR